ncbi:MAG: hypothetical protein GY847_12290, partial [Proteobacteria bacterium]|nr:hypothetical protein [Pseudomonadota bacterium]
MSQRHSFLHVSHTPGYTCYNSLARGEAEKFWYIDRTAWWAKGGPKRGISPQPFIKWVEVKYDPLPAWENMPEHKRQAHFRREVKRIEQHERAKREREGRTVMGPRKLLKLGPRDRPKTQKPRTKQPLCHASSKEAADEYKQELRQFLDLYYQASGYF